jgi:hypothetical protein
LVQRVVGQNGVTEMGEFEMASPAWVFWFQHVKRKASFPWFNCLCSNGMGKQVPSFSRVDWDGKATGSDLGAVALLDYAIYRQGEC